MKQLFYLRLLDTILFIIIANSASRVFLILRTSKVSVEAVLNFFLATSASSYSIKNCSYFQLF